MDEYALEIAMKYNKIFRKYKINLKLADAKGFLEFFKDGAYEKLTFNNDLFVNRETFIGMHIANSYAPNQTSEPERHRDFINCFGEFFDEYSSNGMMCLPTATYAYIGKIF